MRRRRLHRQVAGEIAVMATLSEPNTRTAPDIVLRGRKVVGGRAAGEALVTHQTISGWGGVNAMKGEVIESRHELRGVSFAGKVLVFPGAKGSSGWSAVFHLTRLAGTAPLALAFKDRKSVV